MLSLPLLITSGAIIGAVQFYGTAGYYVGFEGDKVAMFKGRAGGLGWVHPTLLFYSPLTKSGLSADAFDRIAKTVSFM